MIRKNILPRKPQKPVLQPTYPGVAGILDGAVIAALSLTGILMAAAGPASADARCGERHAILN